ncbi:hypothetical protein ACS0TY_029361 [Phlomoides rotata]
MESDIFYAALVEPNNISISHLQYADNTILVGQSSTKNIWSLRCILSSTSSCSQASE